MAGYISAIGQKSMIGYLKKIAEKAVALFPYDYFKTKTALLLENFTESDYRDATWSFIVARLQNKMRGLQNGLTMIPKSLLRYFYHF